MPIYNFACANNHNREIKMTFAEHKELEEDSKGPFIECNIRYGDKNHPICEEKAYQKYNNPAFVVYYGEDGR